LTIPEHNVSSIPSLGIAGEDRELVTDESAARLVKAGGRLVQHARYYWLLLAEAHLNQRRFGEILGRIALLPLRTG